MRYLKSHKKLALTGLAVLACAGAAFAYWTSTGSGTASAKVKNTTESVTLSASEPIGELAPGTSSPVTFKADNANTNATHVGTVHTVISVDSEHATAGCKASDFSLPDVAENQTVPASKTTTLSNTGTLSMANTEEDQSACKGATLTLTLSS